MSWTKSHLEEAFSQKLPGRIAHNHVFSYNRPSVEEIINGDIEPRMSAVVFLMYPKANEWHFLLLKRHDYKGVHSGQVGLPGGSLEEHESNEEAAMREFEEETGNILRSENIISTLSPLYIPPSNFIVQPFAAIIEHEPVWDFDSYEVKRGMEIKLQELVIPENFIDAKVKVANGATTLKVKSFPFEGEVVWGATAMILAECKQILLNFEG